MLMGDYAVTQNGHPGIVAAVDRYVTAVVESAERYHLELPALEITITTADWPSLLMRLREDVRLTLVLRVMVLIHRYAKEAGQRLAPFRVIVTTTEMQTPAGIKYGLGSSAAISVALSVTLLRLSLGRDPSPSCSNSRQPLMRGLKEVAQERTSPRVLWRSDPVLAL